MVSGNLCHTPVITPHVTFVTSHLVFRVSGSPRARPPAPRAVTPMTRVGAGAHSEESSSSPMVVTPPSLAVRAHTPTLWFLTPGREYLQN